MCDQRKARTKDELNAVFNMNKTHQKVSGLSGDYWSSSIASITDDYTAYYVSITGDGIISSETATVDVKKNVIVVKKIAFEGCDVHFLFLLITA